jgi:LuxR family quorum sensing-dependent transcriptional regulator
MAATAQSFGREAFEFIEHLDCLSSPAAVGISAAALAGQFGFEWFVFMGLAPHPGQSFDDLVYAGRFPPGFRELYASRDYGRYDPLVHRAISSSGPFEWHWTEHGEDDGPRASEVMRNFIDFGISGGFITPIHGPGGYEAGVALAGARPDLPGPYKPALHLMMLYAFDRIRQITQQKIEERPPLTSREREVLAWSAQGKSAWEIGEILSVAKRTVDEHAQSAMRKLGATTRTHAVAIALRNRLFEV